MFGLGVVSRVQRILVIEKRYRKKNICKVCIFQTYNITIYFIRQMIRYCKKNNCNVSTFLDLTITINNCFTFLFTALMFCNSKTDVSWFYFDFATDAFAYADADFQKDWKNSCNQSAKKVTYSKFKWFNRKLFCTSCFQWKWFLKNDSEILKSS